MTGARYVRKDGNEEIRGEFTEFKGRKYFSIRAWWRENETSEWKPGKNGINLPVEEQGDFLKVVVKLFGQKEVETASEAVDAAAVAEG